MSDQQSKDVAGPLYDLDQVRGIGSDRVKIGTRTLKRLQDAICTDTLDECKDVALEMLRNLEDSEYAGSVEMDYQPPVRADVYGVQYGGDCFYFKFYEHTAVPSQLIIIVSCHPPEFPLRLKDGRTIFK